MYILAKGANVPNYTLCELRSWLSPRCSTRLHVSGGGSLLDVSCDGASDPDAYQNSFLADTAWTPPTSDFINMITPWMFALDLDGGLYNSNASNARVLSQLVLEKPSLDPLVPSIAEALAVLVSPMLILASQASSFHHFWRFEPTELEEGEFETFNASIQAYEYISSHAYPWQKIFYLVLVPVFVINLICLVYLVSVPGRVTDFTEPQNLFTLAINSPPNHQVDGACGAGPEKEELGSTWRVGYVREGNHYYLRGAGKTTSTGSDESGTGVTQRRVVGGED